MTELLETALAELRKLPAEQQDALAILILEEIASEQRWEREFTRSERALRQLADEALREHRAGRTKPLDPLDALVGAYDDEPGSVDDVVYGR